MILLFCLKLGMPRNNNIQFRPEPEFAGTKKKNPAGIGIFWRLEIFMNHYL